LVVGIVFSLKKKEMKKKDSQEQFLLEGSGDDLHVHKVAESSSGALSHVILATARFLEISHR